MMAFTSHQPDGQNCAPETCGGTGYDPCAGASQQAPGPLGALAQRIAGINMDNGWFDQARAFGDDIALLHSEVSEAFEAFRNGWHPSARHYSDPEYPGQHRLPKPEGVPSELADVLVRVLDTCFRYGIDIDAVLEEKIMYNATRGYRHGGKKV